MFVGERNQVRVKAVGVTVNVPSDDTAKLMYYLSCVNNCLDDFLPDKLTSFASWYMADSATKRTILTTCVLLSPDKLMGKVIFPVKDDAMSSGNEFLEIEQARTQTLVATDLDSAVVIEGRKVTINKIMLFKMSWLDNNFLKPLKRLTTVRAPIETQGSGSCSVM